MCLEQLTQHLEDKLYACLTKNCAFYSEEQDMQSLYLPKCDDKWDLPQENHIEEKVQRYEKWPFSNMAG